MAVIETHRDVLQATARLLLQLADSPDDVRYTHGPEGHEFHVPDRLAEEFAAAANAEPEDDVKPKKKAKG